MILIQLHCFSNMNLWLNYLISEVDTLNCRWTLWSMSWTLWSLRWTLWTDFGQKRPMWRLQVWRQLTSRIQLQIRFFPHSTCLAEKVLSFFHNCKIGFHESSHMDDWVMRNQDRVKICFKQDKFLQGEYKSYKKGMLGPSIKGLSECAKITCRMQISKW